MTNAAPVDAVALLLAPQSASQRHAFRVDLRAARAQVQADAEGFQAIVYQIERLGRHLVPNGNGLGRYSEPLVELVKQSLDKQSAERFRRRLFLLKESRNDNAHQGAHARHAAMEALNVALGLEEALSSPWETLEARDLMVSNPIVAMSWHTLRDVRQQMLLNAFTCIPVKHDGHWYLLRDSWLAGRVLGCSGKRRNIEYGLMVQEVIEHLGEPVETIASSVQLGEIESSLLKNGLILVHDERRPDWPLVGVIAAADLL